MTREEIIKLAREAGMRDYCDSWTVEDDPTRKRPKQIQTDNLARFAVLVAAASASVEREAMVAEAAKQGWVMRNEDMFEDAVREIAAIRERSANAGARGQQ